ncbi:MAG TPA: tripartite tricarboxylate transporter substrate binding protein [Burkholderiales bacterium]|nr:tripartite tricarboxylate transporter substrate binding protein [Burkholderiales bacterium]
MSYRETWTALLASAVLFSVISPAAAQDSWPAKPITYVVPFPAGGTTDTLARIIGQKLSAALGQNVLVDNKPGAGGNIGSDFVAKAKPDGYTILGGTISSHAINASIYPKLPFDPVKDFTPITLIGTNPLVLIVSPSNPAKTVKDVIAQAKAKPGTLAYASAGNGTSQHLAGELLEILAQVDMVHVPYKGSAPAIQDVMGGQVPMMFDTTVVAAPQIKGDKVRALAVTSAKRLKGFESIPNIAESGVPGYEVVSWQGIFAPAGTPPAIVKRLNAEIVKILKMPDVHERLEGLGVEPVANTPEEFAAFQKAEIAKWAKVVKDAGIKAE